jgi:phospholipid transport system substrate-binding protein
LETTALKKNAFLSVGCLSILISSSAFGMGMNGVVQAPLGYSPALVNVNAAAKSPISDKAHDFISNLAQKGIGFLSNKDLNEEKRAEEFRKLLHDNFDMKTIGRFSLGTYWKTSTEDQRKEYLKLFEEMIINVYSRRFGEYNGQKFEVREARAEGDSDAIVSSAIIPEQEPEVKVDWRVREKDGKLKVVDIMVEGISMSLTQRADFASVIQRGGGDIEVLLAHLRPK